MFRISLIFTFLTLCICKISAENQETQVLGALLQAKINAIPVDTTNGANGKIQPGTKMKITAVIKNVGDQPNAPGKLFVRYAFPKPLNNHNDSLIFQTETVALPAIEPGDQFTVNFTTPHQWPSLFDYIRHDWAMREYEAVVTIDKKEQLIGTLAIAFSAYYYEGPAREQATRVTTTSLVRPQTTNYQRNASGQTRKQTAY